jgi:lysophospholipase L1-like esterase
VVVLVLIVGVLWVAAERDTPDVLVFGDSLSFQATPDILSVLSADNLEGRVVARPGARIGDAVPWIRKEAGILSRPRVVVLALGTNDALLPADQFLVQWPAIAEKIDEVLELADRGRCVVWVAPAPALASGGDQARQLTDLVRQKAPAVHILDWPAIAQQHSDVYVGDGVHHTAAGRLRFAAAIAQEGVARLCGVGSGD